MGRYEADRPTLSHRLANSVDGALANTRFKRPKLPKINKNALRSGWGFLFSVGFVLVTIVDPYSGTMASASGTRANGARIAVSSSTRAYMMADATAIPAMSGPSAAELMRRRRA